MESFLGTIMAWGPNFAPRGWAFCAGQLLPINSNQSLFSLIGTIYGGDGRTNFALPDLRGRVPVGAGRGPGLSNRAQGQKMGGETARLTTDNLPPLSTSVNVTATAAIPVDTAAATTDNPTGARLAQGDLGGDPTQNYSTSAATGAMAPASVQVTSTTLPVGSDASFDNMQSYQVVNYIICLEGLFPSRN